jgi:lipoate-protein ligase A
LKSLKLITVAGGYNSQFSINKASALVFERRRKMVWRFINSGDLDAYTNMAVDEAIMTAFQNGLVPPTLRLYGWNPPAVSIGHFQKIDEAVNLEECRARGIDVVRRLTGGRAVLHEHEITYSVIIGEDYTDMPQSVVESYKFISRGIVEGLKLLGADVSMESGKKKDILNSAACFDAASMYEILYEGKKLVGSAQVRKNGVVLQHGSILLEFDEEKLASILRFKSEQIKEKTEAALKNNVVTLSKIMGCEEKPEKICESVKLGFEKVFKSKFIKEKLSLEEDMMIEELAAKYRG